MLRRFIDWLYYSQVGVLAPDGKCKPFDAGADGYVSLCFLNITSIENSFLDSRGLRVLSLSFSSPSTLLFVIMIKSTEPYVYITPDQISGLTMPLSDRSLVPPSTTVAP